MYEHHSPYFSDKNVGDKAADKPHDLLTIHTVRRIKHTPFSMKKPSKDQLVSFGILLFLFLAGLGVHYAAPVGFPIYAAFGLGVPWLGLTTLWCLERLATKFGRHKFAHTANGLARLLTFFGGFSGIVTYIAAYFSSSFPFDEWFALSSWNPLHGTWVGDISDPFLVMIHGAFFAFFAPVGLPYFVRNKLRSNDTKQPSAEQSAGGNGS